MTSMNVECGKESIEVESEIDPEVLELWMKFFEIYFELLHKRGINPLTHDYISDFKTYLPLALKGVPSNMPSISRPKEILFENEEKSANTTHYVPSYTAAHTREEELPDVDKFDRKDDDDDDDDSYAAETFACVSSIQKAVQIAKKDPNEILNKYKKHPDIQNSSTTSTETQSVPNNEHQASASPKRYQPSSTVTYEQTETTSDISPMISTHPHQHHMLSEPVSQIQSPKTLKRKILIDGENVALSQNVIMNDKKVYLVAAFTQAIDSFDKETTEVKIVIKHHRLHNSSDPVLLHKMKEKNMLICTASKANHSRILLQGATDSNAIVLSNSHFKNFKTDPSFSHVLQSQLLRFIWGPTGLILIQDPYGRNGPKLEDILNQTSSIVPTFQNQLARIVHEVENSVSGHNKKKREIWIDGSNVAITYGTSKGFDRNDPNAFSVEALAKVIEFFQSPGFIVVIVIPEDRSKKHRSSNWTIIKCLQEKNLLRLTPSQSYDDRALLEAGKKEDVAVLSNDRFKDLRKESHEYDDVLDNRQLRFNWIFDEFILTEDPYGESGPQLKEILFLDQ